VFVTEVLARDNDQEKQIKKSKKEEFGKANMLRDNDFFLRANLQR
jgi:hypothetical protein